MIAPERSGPTMAEIRDAEARYHAHTCPGAYCIVCDLYNRIRKEIARSMP